MTARTVFTVAALTLQEAARRRVLHSLGVMTVVLLALSAWGFSRLDANFGTLTSGEARLATSRVLNLVMFGLSLIGALGTAFLAGPTLAGEIESGTALAVLARPVRRSAVLLGKWLGLVAFGGGFIAVAGLAQLLIVWARPRSPPPTSPGPACGPSSSSRSPGSPSGAATCDRRAPFAHVWRSLRTVALLPLIVLRRIALIT
jgi:ABC-type transport system involved in multi-copper enzyme maturation permease subunit